MSNEEHFDELVARAAHELTSPLNKAVAFARLLREELDPNALTEEVQTSLSHLTEAADEARAVVVRFHEWARATGIAPTTAVTLSSCLDGALDALGARVQRAEIERVGAFAVGATDTVRADATALRRVLELLLENSFTYVAPGSTPRVRIAARRTGSSWRLIIEDAGLGVERAERERVFEPFIRLHGKSSYPGVGLGLSTARRLIEAHGGRLVLEDSPLGGVRARAELPA